MGETGMRMAVCGKFGTRRARSHQHIFHTIARLHEQLLQILKKEVF